MYMSYRNLWDTCDIPLLHTLYSVKIVKVLSVKVNTTHASPQTTVSFKLTRKCIVCGVQVYDFGHSHTLL